MLWVTLLDLGIALGRLLVWLVLAVLLALRCLHTHAPGEHCLHRQAAGATGTRIRDDECTASWTITRKGPCHNRPCFLSPVSCYNELIFFMIHCSISSQKLYQID